MLGRGRGQKGSAAWHPTPLPQAPWLPLGVPDRGAQSKVNRRTYSLAPRLRGVPVAAGGGPGDEGGGGDGGGEGEAGEAAAHSPAPAPGAAAFLTLHPVVAAASSFQA